MDPKYLLGLYPKYVVRKANNEPLDPEAKYFVLRYDNDPDALYAATLWAIRKGNWALVEDFRKEMKNVEGEQTEELGVSYGAEEELSDDTP